MKHRKIVVSLLLLASLYTSMTTGSSTYQTPQKPKTTVENTPKAMKNQQKPTELPIKDVNTVATLNGIHTKHKKDHELPPLHSRKSHPWMNGNHTQSLSIEEQEQQTTSQATKEEYTVQSTTQSSSETYWVDARATGNGTSENNPAGNITYVLNSYNLTDDVVKVRTGIYNDSIEDFPLTLNCANTTLKATGNISDTLLTGAGWDGAIKVVADNITVNGFKITKNDGRGIYLNGTRHTLIECNIIEENERGIRLQSSNGNKIINNTIGKNRRGIRLENANNNIIEDNNIKNSGSGVKLESSSENRIINNTIRRDSRGIWMSYSTGNEIKDNNITNHGYKGLILDSSSENVITGNRIKNSRKKGLNLRFSSDNVISSNKITGSGGVGIYIEISSNTIIKDNKITNSGRNGIELRSSGNNVIINNNITRNDKGICLSFSSNNNTISCNKIINNGNGIYSASASDNSIVDNKIEHNRDGIQIVSASDNNMISGNSIIGNDDNGIVLSASSGNTIVRNTMVNSLLLRSSNNNIIKYNKIKKSNGGILLSSSSNNTFQGNSITNHRNGIRLLSSGNNTVNGNKITNNTHNGIRLSTSSNNNTIARNIIKHNNKGIRLTGSSGNMIYLNNFIRNGRNARGESGNSFNGSLYGNYWDDYKGEDENGDGIGDTPYRIPGGGKDFRPLTIPLERGLTVGISYPDRKGINQSNITVSWFYYNNTPVASAALYLNTSLKINESTTEYTLTNLTVGETYVINVTAYGELRNTSWDATQFTVDFSSPSLTINSPSANTTLKQFNVTVSWDGSDTGSGLAYYKIKLDEQGWEKVDMSTSYEFIGLGKGTHTVEVRAVDHAGNTNDSSIPFKVVYPDWNLFIGCSTTYVGYHVWISGNLTWGGRDMGRKPVEISSNRTGLIANVITGAKGEFALTWTPTVSGTYKLIFSWQFAKETVTLAVKPQKREKVFSVVSNSTVKGLAFNSTSRELSFTVEGPSGTSGFVNVTIDKGIVANASEMKVYLDGENITYDVISLGDSWLLHFTYEHSTHRINIDLGTPAKEGKKKEQGGMSPLILLGIGAGIGAAVAAVGFAVTAFYFSKKKHTSP